MVLLEKFEKKKKKKKKKKTRVKTNWGDGWGWGWVFIFVIPAGFVYLKNSESKNHQFRVFEN
jgi:hypothetical protein